MAIGTVRPGGGPALRSLTTSNPFQAGAGVGQAISGLASRLQAEETRVADEARRSQEQGEDFAARLEWSKLQGQFSREQLDAVNAAPANGAGLTNSRYEALKKQRDDYIASLPPRLQAEYSTITEGVLQDFTTNTYMQEYKLRSTYETNALTSLAGDLAGEIQAGRTDQTAALAEFEDVLGKSGLSEEQRLAMVEAARTDLGMAQFQKLAEQAIREQSVVRPTDGRDVVLSGLLPGERGLLNAIAARESGGKYNIRYDGGAGTTFNDYSRHPAVFVDSPHGKSSAAGRYQFTYSTWKVVARELGLTDFSPESQDKAAVHLARKVYNLKRAPGARDFDSVLANGTDQEVLQIKHALAGKGAQTTWQAFQHMKDGEFLALFKGEQGVAGGGTGTAELPDVWNDPQFAGLDYATKMRLAGQAQTAASAITSAIESQKEQFAEMLRTQAAAGAPVADTIEQAISLGKFRAKDQEAMIALAEKDREAESTMQSIVASMSGGIPVTNSPATQAGMMKLMQRGGVMEGMQQLQPEAAGQAATMIAASGVMPKQVEDLITSLTRSTDARHVAYGMDMLTSLRAKNPDMFAAVVGKDLAELEGVWDIARRYSPNGDTGAAMEMLKNFRDPAQSAQRETMRTEARKQLQEISNDQIMKEFDPGWFSSTPGAPADPGTAALLRQDFSKLYEMYYPMFNDPEQTKKFAAGQMRHNWGVDEVSGNNRLMYLSPTSPVSGYMPIAGSYDWIRTDIMSSMGWEEGTQFSLVTDGQTEADIAGKQSASYLISRVGEDGLWRLEPDPNNPGMPLRFRFTPSAEVVELSELNAEITNLEEKLSRQRSGDYFFRGEGGMEEFARTTAGALEELYQRAKELRAAETLREDPERESFQEDFNFTGEGN
jgi:muramidase (phage lysozyme)